MGLSGCFYIEQGFLRWLKLTNLLKFQGEKMKESFMPPFFWYHLKSNVFVRVSGLESPILPPCWYNCLTIGTVFYNKIVPGFSGPIILLVPTSNCQQWSPFVTTQNIRCISIAPDNSLWENIGPVGTEDCCTRRLTQKFYYSIVYHSKLIPN